MGAKVNRLNDTSTQKPRYEYKYDYKYKYNHNYKYTDNTNTTQIHETLDTDILLLTHGRQGKQAQ